MDLSEVVLEELGLATADEPSVPVLTLINRVRRRLGRSAAVGLDIPAVLLGLAEQGRLRLPEGTGLFAEVFSASDGSDAPEGGPEAAGGA